jgi:hypothetical protein
LLLQRLDRRRRVREDDVGIERHYLMGHGCEPIVVVGRIAHLDMHIAIFLPTKPFKFLTERRKPLLRHWISLHAMHQDADAPQPRRLLRVCDARPCCCAADQRNEFAPPHGLPPSS